MSSALEKFSSSALTGMNSQSTKMAVVAVAASVTTAAIILGYQGSQRKQRVKQLKDDLRRSMPPPPAHLNSGRVQDNNLAGQNMYTKSTLSQQKQQDQSSALAVSSQGTNDKPAQFDEELVREQLARNIAFLGEEGMEKLRKSFVVIVGAGGVGSWAASMLVRSGVGKVRIIDFDQLSLSSLNRHATANQSDLGTPKAIAMKRTFRTVAPWVQVDARVELFSEDSAEDLLSGNPDYVVDAVGNIKTKTALLKYCFDNKIPVMSSMGAGAKADPSRVQIGDISDTFEDPLAKAVRRKMKKLGVDTGIEVVFSTEKPYQAKLNPESTQSSSEETLEFLGPNDFAPLPNYRVRDLPILCPLPAMFGMSMATFITCKIAGWEMDPLPVKNRDALYQRLHRNLQFREGKLTGRIGSDWAEEDEESAVKVDEIQIALDRREVGYVLEEMYRGKSALSKSMDKVCLGRWIQSEPLSLLNVVVLTKDEMVKHEALPQDADLEKVYGEDAVAFVQGRFDEEEQIRRLY